jgi:hypothetical protein
MTNGPYLYEEGPEPLHTGRGRSHNGHMLAVLAATIVLALGMVAGLFFFRGSPAEQSEEAVGVFLAALAADDTETAHQLLCADERGRLEPAEVAGAYLGETPGKVTGSRDAGDVQRVQVAWADGSSSALSVISEQGPRICGTE